MKNIKKTKQIISLLLSLLLVFAVLNTNYVQAKEKTSKVQITERQKNLIKLLENNSIDIEHQWV